jgi:DNA-binding response OmpR family regulator
MMPASPKILCIEDDVETAELITEELAEHGYTVIWCCATWACRA